MSDLSKAAHQVRRGEANVQQLPQIQATVRRLQPAGRFQAADRGMARQCYRREHNTVSYWLTPSDGIWTT